MTNPIPLSDVLDQISTELFNAETRAKTRGRSAMTFEECEVEFSVSFESSGNAGLKLYVLNFGAGAKHTDTNKIKLKFKSLKDDPIQAVHKRAGDAEPAKRQTKK